LSDSPAAATVAPVDGLALDNNSIRCLFQAKNYVLVIMAVLSFSTFNHMFEQLNVIAVIGLSRNNVLNSLGSVLDLLQRESTYLPIPFPIPFEDRFIKSKELRLAAYLFNKPIAYLCFQLVITTLFGLGIVAYVRGYLSVKRAIKKHKAFINIMQHSK
jgi:hypothetical protein